MSGRDERGSAAVEAVIGVPAFALFVGLIIFLYGVLDAFVRRRVAGANPWGPGATTLEWQLPSPPPFHQWEQLPRVK